MKDAVPENWQNGTKKQQEAYSFAIEKGRELLTDAELGDILLRAAELNTWVSAMKDYALAAILAGREIPGFKAVAGKQSRVWKDGTDQAFDELKKRGVEKALLWNREPVTVPALEKALGKTSFTELAKGLWEKKPGSPSLALASDKRKAYIPAEAAFKPVTNESNEA